MYKQYWRNIIRHYSNKPKNNVRVRFAPSPTGYLHLGGLRTALYNFFFARKHAGKFILRIEDTDQSRLVEDASKQLYNDLVWSGIEIDEGPDVGGSYGPYVQSERVEVYKEQVKSLLNNNTAYYCFCTNKRLELLRKEAVRTRQTPKYDNRCRHLTTDEVSSKLKNGEKFCIRFKLSPDIQTFWDMVYGNISYDITLTEGDPIIIKTDGFPTYHFANVVDDHFMKVSHVLRGVEWQVSTTKHLMMYRAFGWDPPIYGHLPLLVNVDGTKLSKRQGDIQISHYRDREILPQALVNYITISGGGFEKDLLRNVRPKCYSMDELVQQFDVTKINASPGKLSPERLNEFNQLEIQRLLQNPKDESILIEQLKVLIESNISMKSGNARLLTDTQYIREILNWAVDRITKLSDLVSRDFMFLWVIPTNEDHLSNEYLQILLNVEQVLSDEAMLSDWTRENINEILKVTANEGNFPYNKLMKLLRSILSGLKEGPSVAEIMSILGKENTLNSGGQKEIVSSNKVNLKIVKIKWVEVKEKTIREIAKKRRRPRKTTPHIDRCITRLLKEMDVDISAHAICRRLVATNLHGRAARNVPLLSNRNIAARLMFARNCTNGMLKDGATKRK
ncbi:hypothetical protein Trydic_g6805 [Trypoxylus dichotomus]